MTRIGISVAPKHVHVVVVRGSRVVWRGSTPIAVRESLADAIAGLLSTMPPSAVEGRPPRVLAAIGPSWVQLKAIAGLPPIDKPRLLSRLVHENVDSFFLRTATRLVVGEIEARSDGSAWAAAFDDAVLRDIGDGLARGGLRFGGAVPSASALATLGPTSFVCTDGSTCVEVSSRDGIVDRLRPMLPRHGVAPGDPPPLHMADLAMLGREAWPYAAAYAAARLRRSPSFVWRPPRDPRRARIASRIVKTVAIGVVVASFVAMLLAPGIRASAFTARSAGQLMEQRDLREEAARAYAELRRVTSQIESISRFQAERGDVTLLLGELAQALPESTALVSLRVDSLDGIVVALAAHATSVTPRLSLLRRVASPRLIGAINTEAVGGVSLERATIRFRRVRGRGSEDVRVARRTTRPFASR
jgi:hypothetical protein